MAFWFLRWWGVMVGEEWPTVEGAMSETPRTDAVVHNVAELAMFARKLERELQEAKRRIKRLEEFLAELSRPLECECFSHRDVKQECQCCRAEGLLKEAKS